MFYINKKFGSFCNINGFLYFPLLNTIPNCLRPTFLSYTQAGIFTTKLSYEELNFKFTTFLSYEARNPCLRIGDVVRSVFFFVRLSALAKTYSFAIFGCSVGWCELQMCMAFSVGIYSTSV